MNEKPFISMIRSNAVAAITALLGIAIIGLFITLTQARNGNHQDSNDTIHIGIEHVAPLELSLTVSRTVDAALITVGQRNGEEIYVSVPEEWIRHEVRGTELESMTSDPPAFGFTRWRLQPKTFVTFATVTPFTHLVLHNPSTIPIKIEKTLIDLETETVTRDITLIQESPVELW
jgi:hypothetical protein